MFQLHVKNVIKYSTQEKVLKKLSYFHLMTASDIYWKKLKNLSKKNKILKFVMVSKIELLKSYNAQRVNH